MVAVYPTLWAGADEFVVAMGLGGEEEEGDCEGFGLGGVWAEEVVTESSV